jgi:hypothetical protein
MESRVEKPEIYVTQLFKNQLLRKFNNLQDNGFNSRWTFRSDDQAKTGATG